MKVVGHNVREIVLSEVRDRFEKGITSNELIECVKPRSPKGEKRLAAQRVDQALQRLRKLKLVEFRRGTRRWYPLAPRPVTPQLLRVKTWDERGKARLQILADKLRTIKKSSFDLSAWWIKYHDEKSVFELASDIVTVREATCGTSACAFGWAAAIPELRAEGLRFDVDLSSMTGHVSYTFLTEEGSFSEIGGRAASLFFGISLEESMFLFSSGFFLCDYDNPSPLIVRFYCKDGEELPDAKEEIQLNRERQTLRSTIKRIEYLIKNKKAGDA